ncbi:MAG TPA: hypothetical protein VKH42_07710 [Vicinamibacterales bacterium]|nr:hypothetical protein [Vicinamibacterales bacterium]
MDLEVVIEGITDAHLETQLRQQIQQVYRNAPGAWRVMVSPSETRGQWDVGVQGPSCRHFASFTDGVDRLPALVAARLRSCL